MFLTGSRALDINARCGRSMVGAQGMADGLNAPLNSLKHFLFGSVAKLVGALDLGSSPVRGEGSNPSRPTLESWQSWTIAAVLKTVKANNLRGFESLTLR